VTVPRPATLRAAEREVRVFQRLWRGSVSFSLVQPVLFLAAMGLGLGDLVDQNQGNVDGVPYLTFIAPGLLAASAMLVGGTEALWPLMGRLKWLGSYKAMVATPITPGDAFGGWMLWIGLRTAIAAAAFLLVAAVLGAVPSAWGILAVPAAVLCGAAFAAPIGAYTATQENDLKFPVMVRLGLIPLFLFSGTFFPVEELPNSLQPLVWLSPLWHGIELTRGATTGDLAFGTAVVNVAVLAALIAVGARFGNHTFTRRLTP
jgi:lipooligosaccharide transport system permease protein